jgi:hypothetical protein
MSDIKSRITGWVIEKIDNPETKKKVVDKWNSNVNIPILNEKTEEKIFGAIYDSLVDVIKEVLED